MASGLTLKKQNACLHAVRHVVGKKIACIHGLRSEGVKDKIVTSTKWVKLLVLYIFVYLFNCLFVYLHMSDPSLESIPSVSSTNNPTTTTSSTQNLYSEPPTISSTTPNSSPTHHRTTNENFASLTSKQIVDSAMSEVKQQISPTHEGHINEGYTSGEDPHTSSRAYEGDDSLQKKSNGSGSRTGNKLLKILQFKI